MSKENITFIYSAIIREKHTILSEYTEFSGNFSQIITQIMKDIILKIENIPNICRIYFYYGKYAVFFLKYNKVYIITMFPNVKLNNKEIIFAFLYSIFDSLKSIKEIDIEKMDKMKAYTLSTFSGVFVEKIKSFYSNPDVFINYLKNLQTFKIFELPELYFESEVKLPILSKTQTHAEKKNNIEEDENISGDFGRQNSMGTSLNSAITFDSFRDDFLNDGQEENNNLSNIYSSNNIDNDKSENFLKEIEIKEINTSEEKVKEINTERSHSSVIKMNSPNIYITKNNTCFNCSLKVKIIIFVIIILILIGIILGIVFSI
jgi:hypothetical protein